MFTMLFDDAFCLTLVGYASELLFFLLYRCSLSTSYIMSCWRRIHANNLFKKRECLVMLFGFSLDPQQQTTKRWLWGCLEDDGIFFMLAFLMIDDAPRGLLK